MLKGKSFKGIHMLCIMMIIVIILAGCGANNNKSAVDPTAQAAGENANAESAARTIQHEMGSTEIKGTPKRIVTLYQGATDVLVAYGVKPVGVVEAHTGEPAYDYLKTDLAGVPTVGLETQPNLEEIYNLKPDLIIGSKFRNEATYAQLSEIAPTVMVDQVYDWKKTVDLVGQVLNEQDKGKQLLQAWEDRVADFKKKMGDRLPIQASIVNFRADHARIYYMGYAGLILKELGFTRPASQEQEEWGIKVNSKESIPDMDADVIFVFDSGTDKAAIEKNYQQWTSHPLWKNLKAYKNNQIYKVNEVNWNLAGGYISAGLMLDELYDIYKLEKPQTK